MATNKWTSQTPLATSAIRVVLAERCFVAPADTVYSDPAAKLSGSDPASPWQDLGVVGGSKVSLEYAKDVKYVETGFDKVRRGAYLTGKSCKATFTLEQYDMDVFELLTGSTEDTLSPNIGGKLHIGQEDVVFKALLFVGINKVDGKEFYTYSKKAALSFAIGMEDDARVLNCTADFFAFIPAGETVDALFTIYIMA